MQSSQLSLHLGFSVSEVAADNYYFFSEFNRHIRFFLFRVDLWIFELLDSLSNESMFCGLEWLNPKPSPITLNSFFRT
ncbi:hypothetical protein V6N13_067446 [Hibiscus sabdariffa]